ncbi:MAG: cytochrome P450 [Nostoc indistinguendum CM1-VF10]|jgi:cytochrome P450|nr:cytochrome P450 [Nostoc indistinguendum CM1-VF10]
MKLESQSITQSRQQFSTQLKKLIPPGPPELPIVGSLPFMGKHTHLKLNSFSKEYGDVCQFRLGSYPVVLLSKLHTIKEAAIGQKEIFAGRPNFYFLTRPAKGFTLMGNQAHSLLWQKQRAISGEAIRIFLGKTNCLEQQVLKEADELTDTLLNYAGKPFDPEMYIGLAVAGVMFGLLGGRGRQDQDIYELIKTTKDFARYSMEILKAEILPFTSIFYQRSFQKFDHACDVMERLAQKTLKEHQESYDPENVRDMTDAFLKVINELNESEKQFAGFNKESIIGGILHELIGAGTEPTFILLLWIILYMIAYPEVQAELQQELDTIVGRERQPCLVDLGKLPFTEACLHEILRHAPTAPINLPRTTTTDTEVNGYYIQKNTIVFFNLYGLTRDESYWQEPDKFNPRRFLNESGEIRKDLLDKYYPFGIGKRRCTGEYIARPEIFLFFTNLMHKCNFESVSGEKLSFNGIPGFLIRPEKYKVIVKPRF